MKLTCAQMDILISFYIEDELSESLKQKVEEHLLECSKCASNYALIRSMVKEMQESIFKPAMQENEFCGFTNNKNQNIFFKTNLSAYIDNELSNEENLKMKKYTIKNKQAQKDLQDSYNIRKLMKESYKKTRDNSRKDFSKKIIKQLELNDESILNIHPAIKILIALTLFVIILTSLILINFN
ncbi:zf-HC2 domain-containing protein [bacterium]|nr:zf-HC2 domain-containing protein [bacterium]